jgi:hypothetical protein
MLRLLHLADVHLGARHAELGRVGAEQRERQWQAFDRAVDLAVSEHCGVLVIAGDLFDGNAQPQAAVERLARSLARLAAAGIQAVILPGDSDPHDATSIYRAYDLASLGELPAGSDAIHVLVPGRAVAFPALDVALRAFATGDPDIAEELAKPADPTESGVRLRVGVMHRTPTESEGGLTEDAIGASGLDYLALGGGMAPSQGHAAATAWADPGPIELLAEGPGSAGQALLVSLDPAAPVGKRVRIEPRAVGRSRRTRLDLSAGDFADEGALAAHVSEMADPDLACEVRVTGTRPPGLDVDEAALESRLRPGFLHLRVRDESDPPPPQGPVPPPESIAGAFARDVAARMAAAQAAGRPEEARELGEQLDRGLRLVSGSTGMPV